MSIRKRKWTTKGGEGREAWVVDYVDQHGDRHVQTFSTRRAAAAWATQAEHEVAAGTHSPLTGSATVAEAFQIWVENGVDEGLEHGSCRFHGGTVGAKSGGIGTCAIGVDGNP
jgi:integrase